MGPDDADYAVSFAVRRSTRPACRSTCPRTVRVIATSSSSRCRRSTRWSRPSPCSTTCSSRGSGCSCAASPELAGHARRSAFVEYHRFTAVSYKLPLLDALVGMAALTAEMNGVASAGHVKDKLTQLVIYAETVRALTDMAAMRARSTTHGIAVPRPAHHQPGQVHVRDAGTTHALELVQDCAGGLLVTGPGGADWASAEVRPVLEKFFARSRAGRGAAPPAQHDQRPHRTRLRRLPGSARGPRRGFDRGREDADLPLVRPPTRRGLRTTAGGHRGGTRELTRRTRKPGLRDSRACRSSSCAPKGSRSSTSASAPSTMSTSTWRPASAWRCWARTARARPPRS